MGITSELQGVYAEALGGTSTCCTVLEMSNAYATLANGGVHHDPTAITKVVFPNGKVDKPENTEGTRVISDGVAYTVADVMEGTLDFGTAAGQRPDRLHRRGQDRDHRGAVRRVVRRLHARRLDGGLDRQPRRADAAPRLRRRPSRRRSGTTTWMVAATDGCRDFPAPKDPADLSTLLEQHRRVHVDLRHDLDDHRPGQRRHRRPRRRRRRRVGDTNGDGYPGQRATRLAGIDGRNWRQLIPLAGAAGAPTRPGPRSA